MKNEQFYKLLSKTRLNKLIYSLLKPSVSKKINGAYHQAKLETIRENHYSSCIVDRDKTWTQYYYDLDIIVPVYNTGRLLEYCFESVCNQNTRYDYRVIVVNDGSTEEDTLRILEAYSKRDNFTIIAQNNVGIATARNIGLNHSQGRYLLFLDSDDILYANSLELLLDTAYDNDADVVEGAYHNISEDGKKLWTYQHKEGMLNPTHDIYGFLWGKIYKRELFKRIRFPLYSFEDSIVRTTLIRSEHRAYGVPYQIYGYRRNRKSISYRLQGDAKSIDSLYVSEQLNRDRKELGIEDSQDYYEYLLNIIKLTYRRNIWLLSKYQYTIFCRFCDIISEFNNYSTSNSKNRDLEDALRQKNFKWYCIWNEMNMF